VNSELVCYLFMLRFAETVSVNRRGVVSSLPPDFVRHSHWLPAETP